MTASTRPALRVRWTRAVKDAFINAFIEHGSATAALRALGLPRTSAYRQRERDPVFADAWMRAMAESQARLWDVELDAQHHGREVAEDGPDGVPVMRRAPPSERTRGILLQSYAKQLGAYNAARAAAPHADADAAARRRVRLGLAELADRLGILL